MSEKSKSDLVSYVATSFGDNEELKMITEAKLSEAVNTSSLDAEGLLKRLNNHSRNLIRE